MKRKSFKEFQGLSSRQVTLRFRLDPVTISDGNVVFLKESPYITEDSDKSIKKDEALHKNYLALKPLIDKYHQYHIKEALTAYVEDEAELQTLKQSIDAITAKYAEDSNPNIQDEVSAMCKSISNFLKNSDAGFMTEGFTFKGLKSEDFLTKELDLFLKEEDENDSNIRKVKQIISDDNIRKKLSHYCKSLFESRERIYGDKKNSVAYRCTWENLFRFIGIRNGFNRNIKKADINFKDELIERYAHYFDFCNYYKYLTQSGIDEFNIAISEINIKINEYNQSLLSSGRKKNDIKTMNLYPLKSLFKQILSDRESADVEIKEESELLPYINDSLMIMEQLGLHLPKSEQNKPQYLLQNINQFDSNGVYLNTSKLFHLSLSFFNDGLKLQNVIDWRKDGKPKDKFVTIAKLQSEVDDMDSEHKDICDYFKTLQHHDSDKNLSVPLFEYVTSCYNSYKSAADGAERKGALRILLEATLELNRSLKDLSISDDILDYDNEFYEELNVCIDRLNVINRYYNIIRNFYRTQKNDNEHVKIFFDDNEFLKGFTKQENEHGMKHKGYVLRKCVAEENGKKIYDYYLGICNSKTLFREKPAEDSNDISDFELMNYYQMTIKTFKGNIYEKANNQEKKVVSDNDLHWVINYMLKGSESKKIQASVNKEPRTLLNVIRAEDEELFERIAASTEFKRANRRYCQKLLKAINSVVRIPEFRDYIPKRGSLFCDILDDVESMCKMYHELSFYHISQNELENRLNGKNTDGRQDNRLFLFRITNKDLSAYVPNTALGQAQRKSHGMENLHTMYFRSLMDEQQHVFDIGVAEMFFKRAVKPLGRPTHAKGDILQNKNPLNEKKTSKFNYDLYKDRRYYRDSFSLNLSITQNYYVYDGADINREVNEYLTAPRAKYNIIGIDRGERNLLSITLINPQGKILKQKSLNIIKYEGVNANGEPFHTQTDYHKLLKQKEADLKKNTEEWNSVGRIKDLKQGYLSMAVHEIAKMAVEHNAIIVMEKLSDGFMSQRQKYMSNVYQKFEQMLTDKLSFYVDKTKAPGEPGSITNAIQLVERKNVDLSKNNDDVEQNGIIFYVPAAYTSKIDPTTGFVDLLSQHLRAKTIQEARNIFANLTSFGYNKKKKWFEISFDYKKFGVKNDSINTWNICTFGDRLIHYINAEGYHEKKRIALTDTFKKAFEMYDIPVCDNMLADIAGYDIFKHQISDERALKEGNMGFFENLLRLMRYTLQMRNSDKVQNIDYLISPAISKNGRLYCSDDYKTENDEANETSKLPIDADANGAYNIARKGIMAIRNIDSKMKISECDWLKFAQQLES